MKYLLLYVFFGLIVMWLERRDVWDFAVADHKPSDNFTPETHYYAIIILCFLLWPFVVATKIKEFLGSL